MRGNYFNLTAIAFLDELLLPSTEARNDTILVNRRIANLFFRLPTTIHCSNFAFILYRLFPP